MYKYLIGVLICLNFGCYRSERLFDAIEHSTEIFTSPHLLLTSVPPYGSSDPLEGIMGNMDENEVGVAIYIRVVAK